MQGKTHQHGKSTAGVLLTIIIVIGAGFLILRYIRIQQDKEAMLSVMTQDLELLKTLNSNLKKFQPSNDEEQGVDGIARIFDAYVDAGRRIETKDCPPEFTEAFSRSLTAWSDVAEELHNHPQVPSGQEAFLLGLLGGLQGDPTKEVRAIDESLEKWARMVLEKFQRAQTAMHELNAVTERY
jgi:hypothetical protein